MRLLQQVTNSSQCIFLLCLDMTKDRDALASRHLFMRHRVVLSQRSPCVGDAVMKSLQKLISVAINIVCQQASACPCSPDSPRGIFTTQVHINFTTF